MELRESCAWLSPAECFKYPQTFDDVQGIRNTKSFFECHEVLEALNRPALVSFIKEVQQFLETADVIPEHFTLPYLGNMMREAYKETRIDSDTVFLIVTGSVIFCCPEIL